MPVDPHLAAFIAMYDALGLPAVQHGTPEYARSLMSANSESLPPEQEAQCEVEELAIPGTEGDIAVRVYRPQGEGALPTVVFYHGGGWVIGSLDSHDVLARDLSQGARAVVVSVDYRLAPEHPFPAAVEDAVAAARWASERRDVLGGECRLALAGDSAGGNLAAVVAQQLRGDGVPLSGQLLIYPVTDASGDHPSQTECAKGYYLEKDEMDWYFRHYLGDWTELDDPRLSPLHANDLSGLPPTLLVTAEYDLLRDEGEAYGEALEAAGVHVEARRWDGMIHGFFQLGSESPQALKAIEETCARFGELIRA